MKIIGCDLHAAQQTIAMLDRETGEVVEKTLTHQAGAVREFYAGLPAPVVVGLEATGSMGWFLQLLDELGDYVSRGTSGDDPKSRTTQAETRPTRCGVAAAAAGRKSISGDLDPLDGAAGSASVVAAPSSVGASADTRAERRCTRSPWVTAYSGDTRCGNETARRCSRRCRCHPTPPIAAMSCRRCISTWMSRSIGSTTG